MEILELEVSSIYFWFNEIVDSIHLFNDYDDALKKMHLRLEDKYMGGTESL